MDLELSAEQQRIQKELRAYFSGLMTPSLQRALAEAYDREDGAVFRRMARQIGADGWLGVGWPKRYGGQGWGPVEQHLFFEEAMRAEAPVPMLALNTVGPAIMGFGTEEQKERILPAILAGDWHVSIGYTEPDAGTDLASLRTTAVRDGDEWVINGQKVFTTQANFSDCIWLAARTDGAAPRHKGISIFLVDTSLAGVTIRPMPTMVALTTATSYDDVRVPAGALVGEENGGWRLITTQLNYERSSIVAAGPVARVLAGVQAWARATSSGGGRRVIDEPWVQVNLARVHAKLEALRLANLRVAWSIEGGTFNLADASAVKVFGTEMYVEAYHLLMEVVGEAAYLSGGSAGEVMGGQLERACRRAVLTTFGGGVNEIQRDIIAMAGLGLPRSSR